ncbi:hypothetical protein P170DRAFT_111351 [Aspergillus steynii IBT 23096]|uniref:rRNA adenine N(6)-methyltransferase n=1 Tax=Aspergillus steynii IBT 23096 TaxID=1392250 RepID=A0A2I2GIL8_9EURO|nr:uncharacterized protein P170DRAFT_111351 [Aspergillus steynii IBT 23096]PLB52732.1 hypothetical protein P170DRAFT_111351 [Aspergillus steynii IBT 23096]
MSRWTVLPHVPLAGFLNKCYPKNQKKTILKSEIVSERLCDDILNRLSPLLLRNRPVDILDLFPGAGLWSSKVNDFLQPRRHVMVEPNLKAFGKLLRPLAASRSCYTLLSENPFDMNVLNSIFANHFPEQGTSNTDRTGSLPTNNTLLILANPPTPSSKKDHFTPSRWWASSMEHCMHNIGLHGYGGVRLLVSLLPSDANLVLPRNTIERKRPALLTECLARHAFEVAACPDSGHWWMFKGMDVTEQGAARVAQRAADQGMETPKDREFPPYELAPESLDQVNMPCPYVPRPITERNVRLAHILKTESEWVPSTARASGRLIRNEKHRRANTALNQENRHAFIRLEMAKLQSEVDALNRSLSRAAADPRADSTALRPILDQIEALKSEIAQYYTDNHFEIVKQVPISVDDRRALFGTGNADDACLLWDRRPCEPLRIHREELYPLETDRVFIYFEPDPDPPALRKLNKLDPLAKQDAIRFFDALSFTIGTRPHLAVTDVFNAIFPSRSINSLVKAIPSLATFAAKSPKPDFDSLPKTVLGDAEDPSKPLDPADCYQENLDYDLSDVRVRAISINTILDICIEYQKSDQQHTLPQLNRKLGGTLTSFRSGESLVEN